MNAAISRLIKIFDQLPPDQADVLLKKLLVENPLAAMRIIQRHFGFQDLVFADDKGVDALLEKVGEATLHAALHGESNELIKRFALRFGSAKARTFIEDIDGWSGPEAVQETARRRILVKAMMLFRRGQLGMHRPGID